MISSQITLHVYASPARQPHVHKQAPASLDASIHLYHASSKVAGNSGHTSLAFPSGLLTLLLLRPFFHAVALCVCKLMHCGVGRVSCGIKAESVSSCFIVIQVFQKVMSVDLTQSVKLRGIYMKGNLTGSRNYCTTAFREGL